MTRVYASRTVIDIASGRFALRETLVAMSMEEWQAITGAELYTDGLVADFVVPAL